MKASDLPQWDTILSLPFAIEEEFSFLFFDVISCINCSLLIAMSTLCICLDQIMISAFIYLHLLLCAYILIYVITLWIRILLVVKFSGIFLRRAFSGESWRNYRGRSFHTILSLNNIMRITVKQIMSTITTDFVIEIHLYYNDSGLVMTISP